jgi:hypothetical protein
MLELAHTNCAESVTVLKRRRAAHHRVCQNPMGLTEARARPMSETTYFCKGFYPIQADNLAHAAKLFALWEARRTYGPKASCSRVDLRAQLQPNAATFEALIDTPLGNEACMLTISVDEPQ